MYKKYSSVIVMVFPWGPDEDSMKTNTQKRLSKKGLYLSSISGHAVGNSTRAKIWHAAHRWYHDHDVLLEYTPCSSRYQVRDSTQCCAHMIFKFSKFVSVRNSICHFTDCQTAAGKQPQPCTEMHWERRFWVILRHSPQNPAHPTRVIA